MGHGGFLPQFYQAVDGCLAETGRAEAFGVCPYRHVRDGDVFLELVLAVHVNDMSQYAAAREQILSRTLGGLHRGADDVVRSHFPGYIGGIVVTQSAVHQYVLADAHRGEHGGNGHAGAHGLG